MIQVSRKEFDLSRSNLSFDVKSETSTEGEESDFGVDYQSILKSGKGPCSKAKTSLCKNFT
jgi:hypothetical protein